MVTLFRRSMLLRSLRVLETGESKYLGPIPTWQMGLA